MFNSRASRAKTFYVFLFVGVLDKKPRIGRMGHSVRENIFSFPSSSKCPSKKKWLHYFWTMNAPQDYFHSCRSIDNLGFRRHEYQIYNVFRFSLGSLELLYAMAFNQLWVSRVQLEKEPYGLEV